jgi:hypothetical protein
MNGTSLIQRAAEALRQARKLPVGAERNELRQVALGLKWMAERNRKAGQLDAKASKLLKMDDECPTYLPITALERPRCPRCQIRMMLAGREPRENGSEKRTFECNKCDFIETKIVADPLKSDAVVRLAESLRPPS